MGALAKSRLEICFFILMILFLYFRQFEAWDGLYADSDNYMHAMRLIEWLKSFSWLEQKFLWTNYPYGEVSHWTRLMDILLLICSLPFLLFYPVKEAVFNGSLLLSPIMSFLIFIILYKLSCMTLNFRGRIALFLLLLVQSNFVRVLFFYRPDHHSVIIFFAACLLFELYLFVSKCILRSLIVGAIVCALSLWLAVEGIYIYLLSLFFLYINHLIFHTSFRSLKIFSTIYSIAVTCFYLLNPPYQGYLFLDNGRLSLFYVALSIYISIAIWGAGKIQKTKLRFLFLCLLAFLALCIIFCTGLFNSPLDNNIKDAFTNRISEMQSGTNIYYLTYPALGLMSLAFLWYRKTDRSFILLLFVFLGGYTILSLWAIRFLSYVSVYSALALALFLGSLPIRKMKFTFLLILTCCAEFISFIIWSMIHYDLLKPIDFDMPVNVHIIKHYSLAEGSVVSDVFLGPYIIWYANRPVVSSPYHRNVEGIVDNHRILFSSDEDEVIKLLLKHKVKTILLPYYATLDYFINPKENCDKLYGKIYGCQNYPDWLKLKFSDKNNNLIFFEIENLPE